MGTKQITMSLLLLIAEPNLNAICLRNLKKSNEKLNTKTLEQYDYIHDSGNSGGVSILIRKNILQNKINIKTHLQAIVVSATLHETVSICSLYIPHYPINKKYLNNL